MDYSGERFLNKLYQDLYRSKEVQREVKRYEKNNRRFEYGKKNEKVENISIFLKRLEEGYRSVDTKRKKDLLKELFYEKYLIDINDIPSYLDKESILQNQKNSLDKWIDYLTDPNAKYEMWAKYWAFQGMLKMGSYDEAKGSFTRRSKKTVNPFIECNPEVVANCINVITKYVHGEKIDDERLNKLVCSGNFSRIYTLFYQKYRNIIKEKSDYKDGKWVKYNYGSLEDAIKLYKSLENKNTGWCTANKDFAINQVCGGGSYTGGDFYVYYTKDRNNNYTIPRIAIRLNKTDSIEEISGISDGQNLEDGLEDILKDKLNSFSFLSDYQREKYLDKIHNASVLTSISKKTFNNMVLNREESLFLWYKSGIYLFGFGEQSKVNKIREKRIENRLAIKDLDNLSNNEKVEAIKRHPKLIKVLDPKMDGYDELVSSLVKRNSYTILDIDPKNVKNYDELLIYAINDSWGIIKFIDPKKIKDYDKIILDIVKKNGRFLQVVDPKRVSNYELIAWEAVKNDGSAIDYVDKNYIKDFDKFVLEMVKYDGKNIRYVDPKMVKNYDEVVLAATIQATSNFIYYVNPKDINNYDALAKQIIKNDKDFVSYVDPKRVNNYDELAGKKKNR